MEFNFSIAVAILVVFPNLEKHLAAFSDLVEIFKKFSLSLISNYVIEILNLWCVEN